MKDGSGVNKELTKLFGRNLQLAREAHGFTREELAEKANVSPQNLARIESGQRFLSSDLLVKLSKSMQIQIAELFKEDDRSKSTAPAWRKIEKLLKGREEEDIELAHAILALVFKRLPKGQ
jgi:transcriptional regulator with XRE-family HTH domain